MADFVMPEVGVGDLVFWYDNPGSPTDPAIGWVIERPGKEAISVLVFSQNAGFVEKKSVRHRDDPFWRESEMANNWQHWGCWAYHPSTEMMRELRVLLTKSKIEKAKGQKGEAA